MALELDLAGGYISPLSACSVLSLPREGAPVGHCKAEAGRRNVLLTVCGFPAQRHARWHAGVPATFALGKAVALSSVEGLSLAKILPSRHVAAPAIHQQSTLWHGVA